jgi:DNA-binding CsgD family transcriptional regulator
VDWSATACLEAAEKSQLLLQISRSDAEGEFTAREVELIRLMSAHFERSIKLRRKISNAKVISDYQAQALDSLGIGGILIEPDRAVTPLNRTAQLVLDSRDGLRIVNQRLYAIQPAEDVKLQRAIKAALEGGAVSRTSRGILISRQSDERSLGIVVTPRSYQSLTTDIPRNCALVFVRKGELLTAADTDLMQELFGFTRAEARLAVWLASGTPLEEIEDKLNIRHNTARAHLRSIYGKAEVTSQSELIQLLASSAAPLGRNDLAADQQSPLQH